MTIKSDILFLTILLTVLIHTVRGQGTQAVQSDHSCRPKEEKWIAPADHQISDYIQLLKGKRVGLIIHQASVISNRTLADTLINLGINIKAIFVPEHGFRGDEEAGAVILDQKDVKTGLPLISLYGKNKKPTSAQLAEIDLMVYDLQDVGVRFYTYISTLHYVMEACAENQKTLVVLDRPNPNDHYTDGPIMEEKYHSFVGMHKIPIVYGMTCGELALMINGEHWLKNGLACKLNVITMKGYKHGLKQRLSIKPSPNLPNLQSILLYPSLCLFEGTEVSIGRGTDYPFQLIGAPYYTDTSFAFTPKPRAEAKKPPLSGQTIYGINLTSVAPPSYIDLSWLIKFYELSGLKEKFFSSPEFFDKLAGTSSIRESIIQGKNDKQIRETWTKALEEFKTLRQPYLLYP